MGELGCRACHGHARGQLSLRGRYQAHPAGPGELARFLCPSRLRVAGLGRPQGQCSVTDQLRRRESYGDCRGLTCGFEGTLSTTDDAIFCEGRTAESWAARLCVLNRKLGSVSDDE